MLLGGSLLAPLLGAAPHDVLILSSYRPGQPWTDSQILGVHERMQRQPFETRLWVDYLDAVRSPEATREFTQWFRARHGGKRFSAIVALDDAAIRYVLEHGGLFGTSTPVVYGGLNNKGLRDQLPRSRFTGVFEDFTLDSILQMAWRLHPDRKRGVVIHDSSSTGRGVAETFREEERRAGGARFEYWSGTELTQRELEARLRSLADDQLVFLLPMNSLREQPYVPSHRVVTIVAAATQAPVYAVGMEDPDALLFCSTANMGKAHGHYVARQLIRVLRGEPPARIAVINDELLDFVFDYKQLARWGVESRELPSNSSLAHEPDGLFYRYGNWIAAAAVLALAQTGIMLLLMANIWKRRRAERALQEALLAEKASSKVKSEFLANMSHELRTPLNGLLGMSQLLHESSLTEEQRLSVDAIQSCGGSLMNLLNDILEHSRLAAGHVRHEPRSTDIAQVAREVVQLLEPAALRAGLELRVETSGETPAAVMLDPHRVKQVLTNLISNAIKFTASGSVTLRMQRREGRLRFEVEDTGPGIRREDQERIFERFQQVESGAATPSGGVGLGLTICSQVVAAMSGRIGVESKEGEGSTFWFELPLHLPEGTAVEMAAAAAPVEMAGDTLEGRTVLLVEDNSTNSLIIERTLTRRGCVLTCVEDGLKAVELATRSEFDVILMDIQLPGIDGVEAIRRIRAAPGGSRGALIVALTAFAFEEDRQRCLAAGADDHISKPVNLRFLRERIAQPRKPLG
ncbi:MAG: response regulator [Acidobacteria bacterium]|nr:response regulator [Acidobacteriota bacterium]